ncbi:type II toxin-antitoxin system RelE/ParE family toxin [Salmonella enterica]|uniref:type II toxin-antitoxin system RelE/ParE family toxin n=1 Tax=Salmonella enterica TaxID=28901 RepID=UPI003A4C835F
MFADRMSQYFLSVAYSGTYDYNITYVGTNEHIMIKSFKHKGLKKFYQKGDSSGLEQSLVPRLKNRLSMLDAAKTIDFMNQQGYDLHELKGNRADTWSVKVSGNWRLTFIFENGDVYVLNLEDYH